MSHGCLVEEGVYVARPEQAEAEAGSVWRRGVEWRVCFQRRADSLELEWDSAEHRIPASSLRHSQGCYSFLSLAELVLESALEQDVGVEQSGCNYERRPNESSFVRRGEVSCRSGGSEEKMSYSPTASADE